MHVYNWNAGGKQDKNWGGPWSVVKNIQHDKGQYYFLISLILWVLKLTITVRQVDLLIFLWPGFEKVGAIYWIWVVCHSVHHNFVSAQYLENNLKEFNQILYVH